MSGSSGDYLEPNNNFDVWFEGVTYAYHSPSFEIEIPSLSIEQGESVSVIGRSGSGKTTLLSLALGLVSPATGQISVHGLPPRTARANGLFGVAFQNASLLPWRSVEENASLPWLLRGEVPDSSRINELLNRVGLSGYENAYPSELSGGMQSRVSLVRALAYRPKVLVLDEPFSSLDEATRNEMATLVSNLQRASNASMILVTHNITEALLMSDRVLLLMAGKDRRPSCIVREFVTEFRGRKANDVIVSKEFREIVEEITGRLTEG